MLSPLFSTLLAAMPEGTSMRKHGCTSIPPKLTLRSKPMKKRLLCLLTALLLVGGCTSQTPPAKDPNSAADAPLSAQVPILLYHAFCEDPADVSSYTWVSTSRLEEQLSALQTAGYQSVTLSQLVDFVQTGTPLPEKPVLLTADDGYLNNLTLAAPLLEQYGFSLSIAVIGVSEGKDSYKDTGTAMIPHFSLQQAQPWVEKGVIELFSHTYDMHQGPLDPADHRESVLQMEGESDADYAAALRQDFSRALAHLAGLSAPALAYPHGMYSEQSEAVAHSCGFAVTLSTQTGGNTVTFGDPESLYLLHRNSVTQDITGRKLVALLDKLTTT